MSEWPRHRVDHLQSEGILFVEDGNHGEYRPRQNEFQTHGTAFIRAADMDAGQIHFESAQKINRYFRFQPISKITHRLYLFEDVGFSSASLASAVRGRGLQV